MSAHLNIETRHEAVILFDCKDGNPNGDPDANNQPRTDAESRHGLVTDACLKRKVRNYIAERGYDLPDSERYKLFVEAGTALNDAIARAYTEQGIDVGKNKKAKGTKEQQQLAQSWMLENFFDVRMFGAVLSTGYNAGQVLGPLQFSFSRSIDPVFPVSHTLTRCAVTDPKDGEAAGKDNKTMGRKETINYGLYRGYIFYNPNVRSEAFTQQDLELFWEALVKMFEYDRSAARGFMACRGLYVFSHESKWGNAPTHELFDTIKVQSNNEIPRDFNDYEVSVGDTPDGVTLTRLC